MVDLEYELAGCIGKEKFSTYSAADRVQRRRARQGRDKRMRQSEIYRCRSCGGYHLGTSRPEMQKKELSRFMNRWRRRGTDGQTDTHAT